MHIYEDLIGVVMPKKWKSFFKVNIKMMKEILR